MSTRWKSANKFRHICPLPLGCEVSPSEAALSYEKTADASRASGKSNFKICMTLPHPCDRLDGDVPDAKVKSRTGPST